MSIGLRRCLAVLACHLLQGAMPPGLEGWGRAIRLETRAIEDDGDALVFALGSLCGLAPRIFAHHLFQPIVALFPGRVFPWGDVLGMPLRHDGTSHPRSIGIVCAVGAALLGLVYLTMAGAPMRYLGVNAGALLIGLAMLAMVGGTPWRDRRWSGVMTLAMAILLLGTALFGDKDQDAARWVRLGPLFIQPSLVLLPVMIVRFAQSPNGRSTLGMVIAAVALALQPDRAMAGMLATGLAVLVMMRPDAPFVTPAFASGVASFAVTLIRTDTLRPTPYVEKVFYSAFDVHIVAGLLVMTGAALLLVPAIVGKLCDADHQETYLVFGAVWFTAILSAALGNYPTPIVGYGGSAVIGYVLSLTMLPKTARPRVGAEAVPHDGTKGGSAVYRCPSAVAYLA